MREERFVWLRPNPQARRANGFPESPDIFDRKQNRSSEITTTIMDQQAEVSPDVTALTLLTTMLLVTMLLVTILPRVPDRHQGWSLLGHP